MGTIGLVTGMVAEVRALGPWAAHPALEVAVSGADPARAEAEAARLAQMGCRVLVSWGLAGGLAPDLASGALLRPNVVALPDGVCLDASMGTGGMVLGVDHVVVSPAEKRHLHAQTGAVAVDMESHRLARVAADAGIALTVVRAVSDPATRALPGLAATALGPDGRPRIGHVMAGLVQRPWDLPGLLAAKRDSDRALAALAGAADAVFSDLMAAYPDR